jgi:hypothetical protein
VLEGSETAIAITAHCAEIHLQATTGAAAAVAAAAAYAPPAAPGIRVDAFLARYLYLSQQEGAALLRMLRSQMQPLPAPGGHHHHHHHHAHKHHHSHATLAAEVAAEAEEARRLDAAAAGGGGAVGANGRPLLHPAAVSAAFEAMDPSPPHAPGAEHVISSRHFAHAMRESGLRASPSATLLLAHHFAVPRVREEWGGGVYMALTPPPSLLPS